MALLFAEAKDLTVPDLVMGIATEIFTKNPLMQIIPWAGTDGASYDYNREATNPTAAFVADDGALTSGALLMTRKTAAIKALYVQNDISGMAQSLVRQQDPKSVLLLKMAKSLSEKIKNASILGAGTGSEFAGLEYICSDSDTSRNNLASTAAAGAAISFTLLRTLLDEVHGATAILANSRTIRSIKSLYDALGGTVPTLIMSGGYRAIEFEGVPILPVDAIPIDDTLTGGDTGTAVYAIRTNPQPGLEDDGVSFIYANKYPLGFKALDLGALEAKDNDRMRLMQYMAMVTHSTLAVGSLNLINN